MRLVRSPVQFRLAGAPDTEPARNVGEDTLAVLQEYGYTPEEIQALRDKRIVGVAGESDVHNRYWNSKFDGCPLEKA